MLKLRVWTFSICLMIIRVIKQIENVLTAFYLRVSYFTFIGENVYMIWLLFDINIANNLLNSGSVFY